MKTFDNKDIFSWSNAEEAKTYIGREGYFADSLKELQECVSNDDFYTLSSIDFDSNTDVDSIFLITNIDYRYALFLPSDKVKKVEEPKKWRPFGNMDEFTKCILNSLNVSPIHYIIEIEDTFTAKQCTIQILGKFKNGLILPIYGAQTFEQLFNRFKIFNDYHEIGWQPFGVEE